MNRVNSVRVAPVRERLNRRADSHVLSLAVWRLTAACLAELVVSSGNGLRRRSPHKIAIATDTTTAHRVDMGLVHPR